MVLRDINRIYDRDQPPVDKSDWFTGSSVENVRLKDVQYLKRSFKEKLYEQLTAGLPPWNQQAQSLLTIDVGVTQPIAATQSRQTVEQVRFWPSKFRSEGESISPEELKVYQQVEHATTREDSKSASAEAKRKRKVKTKKKGKKKAKQVKESKKTIKKKKRGKKKKKKKKSKKRKRNLDKKK